MTATKLTVWYELNLPDCEPELMREVASVGEAWDTVRADIAAACGASEDAVPLSAYALFADRAAFVADPAPAAIFAQPDSVAPGSITWVAIECHNTYFLFGGDADDWRCRPRS